MSVQANKARRAELRTGGRCLIRQTQRRATMKTIVTHGEAIYALRRLTRALKGELGKLCTGGGECSADVFKGAGAWVSAVFRRSG